MHRTSTWWLSLLVVTAIGCDRAADARATSLPVLDRGPGPSASSDPVGAALHRQVVGHALDFEEVGAAVTGELEPGRVHTHPMVLIGTWCYRVFAQGGSGMEDLSLEVVDPNGVPMQRDSEIGPSASLGLVDAICPYAAGRYTLNVGAARGGGSYAYRVFRKQAL